MSAFYQTCEAGPSYSDKGKAKELLKPYSAPAWYPTVEEEDEEAALDAQWWGAMGEASMLASGTPSVPRQLQVAKPPAVKRKGRRRPSLQDGNDDVDMEDRPRRVKQVKLETVVIQSVDDLASIRRTQHKLSEFQRLEAEGAPLPRMVDPAQDEEELEVEEQTRHYRQAVKIEQREAAERERLGAETGEEEATESLRQASAALLAHAGFEGERVPRTRLTVGANEMALNTFTKVAADQLSNLGRTFRLLMDHFSERMTSEEIILHALFENGGTAPALLEGYIRDDIDRSALKVADVLKKTRQAYVDVVSCRGGYFLLTLRRAHRSSRTTCCL